MLPLDRPLFTGFARSLVSFNPTQHLEDKSSRL